MPLIRAIRVLNAMEAGTLSGSALDTLFSDAVRWAEFNTLLTMPGQVRRILAASTTRSALASSGVAGAQIVKSSTARSTLLSDSSFLNELFAGSGAASGIVADADAFGIVLSQVSMRMAMFNSDVMLGSIASTPAALTAARASSAYAVVSQSLTANTNGAISGLNAAGSYVLLGVSKAHTFTMGLAVVNTRRSGSTRPNSVGNFGTAANDATSQTVVTPLVAPFNATPGGVTTTWYFGVLRCDA